MRFQQNDRLTSFTCVQASAPSQASRSRFSTFARLPQTPVSSLLSAWIGRNAHPAWISNKVPTELCTAISVNGHQVKTIEHLLPPWLAWKSITCMPKSTREVPVFDGSSSPFVRLIRAAGIIPANRRQSHVVKIMQPSKSGRIKAVRIEPSSTSKITYSIHMITLLIQTQSYSYTRSAPAFEQDIAMARDIRLSARSPKHCGRGLGKRRDADNTIVLSQEGVVNEQLALLQ